PLTERTIRHAVQTTSKDRTTVIIAHRLDTIADADQVVVLEHGKIVEAGPPRQLRARGGRFSDLWRASSNATHSLGGDDRCSGRFYESWGPSTPGRSGPRSLSWP